MINIVRLILKYCGIFKITGVDNKDEQMEYSKVVSLLLVVLIIFFLLILIS